LSFVSITIRLQQDCFSININYFTSFNASLNAQVVRLAHQTTFISFASSTVFQDTSELIDLPNDSIFCIEISDNCQTGSILTLSIFPASISKENATSSSQPGDLYVLFIFCIFSVDAVSSVLVSVEPVDSVNSVFGVSVATQLAVLSTSVFISFSTSLFSGVDVSCFVQLDKVSDTNKTIAKNNLNFFITIFLIIK
jgi:hypothetical protein